MGVARLKVDHALFSGELNGEVVSLSFRERPLLHVMDLSAKKALFDYLDLVAGCDEAKVLLIKESQAKMRRAEYIAFYRKMIVPHFDQLPLERMYNAVGQLILKLIGLNKMVVHADRGDVILLFMNIGLACDYRIVAADTVFQNPNIELGVVPKGGSVFFLSRMLGAVTASRIMFSGEDIAAGEALRLGIVDKVVPVDVFDREVLESARAYTRLPAGYAVGIKRLLNYDINDLACFLEYENALLRRLVRSASLQNFGGLSAVQ